MRAVHDRGCVQSCDHVAEWYMSDDVWQDIGVTEGVRRDVRKVVKNDQERCKVGVKGGSRKEPCDRSSEHPGGRIALS